MRGACRNRCAAAPTAARVVSSSLPCRRSSIEARPSSARARSMIRSGPISPEKYNVGTAAAAARIAMPRPSADFPLPTSPARTTRSLRRSPPASIRSSDGKPVATVSGAGASGDRVSIWATRFCSSESDERAGLRVGRGMAEYKLLASPLPHFPASPPPSPPPPETPATSDHCAPPGRPRAGPARNSPA